MCTTWNIHHHFLFLRARSIMPRRKRKRVRRAWHTSPSLLSFSRVLRTARLLWPTLYPLPLIHYPSASSSPLPFFAPHHLQFHRLQIIAFNPFSSRFFVLSKPFPEKAFCFCFLFLWYFPFSSLNTHLRLFLQHNRCWQLKQEVQTWRSSWLIWG